MLAQLTTGGVVDLIGADAVYGGDERVGAALARASEDARAWVASGQVGGSDLS